MFNPTRHHPIMRTPTSIPREDSRAWTFQVWASFGLAISLAGTGLAWLPGQELDRAFESFRTRERRFGRTSAQLAASAPAPGA